MPAAVADATPRRVDFLELGIDDVIVFMRPVPRPASDGKAPHMHPGFHVAENGFANGRQQQKKPDRIGKEARCEQKRAGEDDHGAIRQRLARIFKAFHGLAQPHERIRPLRSHQKRAGESCYHDDCKGRPEADQPAHLDEQRNLDQRNRDEKQKEPHDIPPSAGRKVDLPPAYPYICADHAGFHPQRRHGS